MSDKNRVNKKGNIGIKIACSYFHSSTPKSPIIYITYTSCEISDSFSIYFTYCIQLYDSLLLWNKFPYGQLQAYIIIFNNYIDFHNSLNQHPISWVCGGFAVKKK